MQTSVPLSTAFLKHPIAGADAQQAKAQAQRPQRPQHAQQPQQPPQPKAQPRFNIALPPSSSSPRPPICSPFPSPSITRAPQSFLAMAFQPPAARQLPQSSLRDAIAADALDHPPVASVSPAEQASPTWVLFSPSHGAATATASSSALSSLSSHLQPTPGRSRLSGSVVVASSGPLSSLTAEDHEEAGGEAPPDPEVPDPDEEAALDSLDNQLADFRQTSPQALQTSAVSLPTHDGLGTFWGSPGLERTTGGAGMAAAAVQERLYAFEQFNPRRINKRRRDSASLDLAQLQAEQDVFEEMERTRRIEAWRWEHSRVLLQEIRKETRRRRGSEMSSRRSEAAAVAAAVAAASAPETTDISAPPADTSASWHDQDDDLLLFGSYAGDDLTEADEDADEGLWSRITRRFMLEVMGIDDEVLAILLGEALPEEANAPETLATSAVPTTLRTQTMTDPLLQAYAQSGLMKEEEQPETTEESSWRLHVLERIAQELGQLVHRHLATHHPGAFSTYQRVQQMPLPYAGLSVIPEARTPPEDHVVEETKTTQTANTDDVIPPFQPTILQAKQAADARPREEEPSPQTFTQQEWEQDLDIKLVFRYLRSRFLPLGETKAPEDHSTAAASVAVTSALQDAAAKAARVRQHHPLVGGRGAGKGKMAAAPAGRPKTAGAAGARHAHHGSCASQSTRRSARHSSVSSSRHYWDIGGSIGTGSVIASAGPMGSWGEV